MMETLRPRPRSVVREELLPLLERFLEPYRVEIRRQDQMRRAAAYLLGLLCATGRKNIENLARAVSLPPEWGIRDVAQALQHLVNQSPWDEEAVHRAYLQNARREDPREGVLVVTEQTFVKQGRHSVGVQRQYSSALSRKVNCQLAVALHHVGPTAFVPLGVRLYIPRGWLQDTARLELAGVPQESGSFNKSLLALALLDRALECGWIGREVAIGACVTLGEEFREGVRSRGLELIELPDELASRLADGERRLLDELGLEHFEGRSWRGFHHHACLVLLAHEFLRGEVDKSLE